MEITIKASKREAEKYVSDYSLSNEELMKGFEDDISFHLEANGIYDPVISITITHD
ncbi:hypothetical protein Xets_03967 [Xenorhabdus sp. TS4]|nr:hypothetical protein [Xenorhabdus sp. TS4]